jgi:hypothetical protein
MNSRHPTGHAVDLVGLAGCEVTPGCPGLGAQHDRLDQNRPGHRRIVAVIFATVVA